MRIEFKDDDNYKPQRHYEDGIYEAVIDKVKFYEKNRKEQFLVITFKTEKFSIVRYYPTMKNERWKLKLLLRCVGIEKNKETNTYSFEDTDLLGKKVVITVANNKIIKVEPYTE